MTKVYTSKVSATVISAMPATGGGAWLTAVMPLDEMAAEQVRLDAATAKGLPVTAMGGAHAGEVTRADAERLMLKVDDLDAAGMAVSGVYKTLVLTAEQGIVRKVELRDVPHGDDDFDAGIGGRKAVIVDHDKMDRLVDRARRGDAESLLKLVNVVGAADATRMIGEAI